MVYLLKWDECFHILLSSLVSQDTPWPFLDVIMTIKFINILSILHRFSKLSVPCCLACQMEIKTGKKISAYCQDEEYKELTHMQLPFSSSFPPCPSPLCLSPVSSLNPCLVTQFLWPSYRCQNPSSNHFSLCYSMSLNWSLPQSSQVPPLRAPGPNTGSQFFLFCKLYRLYNIFCEMMLYYQSRLQE